MGKQLSYMYRAFTGDAMSNKSNMYSQESVVS